MLSLDGDVLHQQRHTSEKRSLNSITLTHSDIMKAKKHAEWCT